MLRASCFPRLSLRTPTPAFPTSISYRRCIHDINTVQSEEKVASTSSSAATSNADEQLERYVQVSSPERLLEIPLIAILYRL